MGFLTGKKLLLLGFVVVLLAAIPITLLILRSQTTETRTRATKSTRLYFMQNNSSTFPIQKNVGDTFTLDIMMDPGSNQIIGAKLDIVYDATKLSITGTGLKEESSAFPSVLEGPVYTNGNATIVVTLAIDVTRAIKTNTKVATITFKADNPTGSTPTPITFGSTTQVTSTADPEANVLSSSDPASVLIGGGTTPTPTTTISVTPTPSVAVLVTPVPGNKPPVCTSLSVTPGASGVIPFTLTLTTNGSDPNGTISKATFNFGDGSVQDVLQGGGIGTSTVSASLQHTYATAGKFSSSAILTDNNAATSTTGACTQIITVEEPTPMPTTTVQKPTLEPQGPGDTFIGIGVVAAILAVIGGVFFFAL